MRQPWGRRTFPADADRDAAARTALHNTAHPVGPADVSGVDADLVGSGLGALDGHAVIKMDIGHNGNGHCLFQLIDKAHSLLARHRDTQYLAAPPADIDPSGLDLICHDSNLEISFVVA